jgi:hypothetical protein
VAQQPNEIMRNVPPTSGLLQAATGRDRQTQGIVVLAAGEQTRAEGDSAAAELQPQPTVKGPFLTSPMGYPRQKMAGGGQCVDLTRGIRLESLRNDH